MRADLGAATSIPPADDRSAATSSPASVQRRFAALANAAVAEAVGVGRPSVRQQHHHRRAERAAARRRSTKPQAASCRPRSRTARVGDTDDAGEAAGPRAARSATSPGRGRTSPVQACPSQRRTRRGSCGSGYHAGGWERRGDGPLTAIVYVGAVGALVVLAAQAGSIEPGSEAETVVLVRNTGEDEDTFHVVVQGDASRWAVVDPPSGLTLGRTRRRPSGSTSARPARRRRLRDPSLRRRRRVSTEDPEFVAVETGQLDIGTYSSLAASFVGEPTIGPKCAELELSIRNTGNRRVDRSRSCRRVARCRGARSRSNPGHVDLPPGQPVNVAVRVRPPRRRILPGRKRDRRDDGHRRVRRRRLRRPCAPSTPTT